MKRGSSITLLSASTGFTLLELLVVLVIIGLLAGYVGPKYFSQVGKAEAKVASAQIQAFEKALAQYRLDNGQFPTTEQGLNALVTRPANAPKWAGPYLAKAVPLGLADCVGYTGEVIFLDARAIPISRHRDSDVLS